MRTLFILRGLLRQRGILLRASMLFCSQCSSRKSFWWHNFLRNNIDGVCPQHTCLTTWTSVLYLSNCWQLSQNSCGLDWFKVAAVLLLLLMSVSRRQAAAYPLMLNYQELCFFLQPETMYLNESSFKKISTFRRLN